MFFFFFFKQKTAYEMRISDWSSDVCSSDLEQIVMRNEDVVEEEFGRVLRVHADLVEVAAAPKTLGLVGLDDEQRDALGARRRRVGLGDHDDDTAILAVLD